MWQWLSGMRWWGKATLALLLLLSLLLLVAWLRHTIGWQEFRRAATAWRDAGTPDSPSELIERQPPIDRQATKRWLDWVAEAEDAELYALSNHLQESVDAALQARPTPSELPDGSEKHLALIERGWKLQCAEGCDPTWSGSWQLEHQSLFDLSLPPFGALRVLCQARLRLLTTDIDSELAVEQALQDLDTAVARCRHPDNSLDLVQRSVLIEWRDQGYLLAARRGCLPTGSWQTWLADEKELLSIVPAILRREHAGQLLPLLYDLADGTKNISDLQNLLKTSSTKPNLWSIIEADILDYLDTGFEAARICRNLIRIESWRPGHPMPHTRSSTGGSTLSSIDGNNSNTALTAWIADARQRAYRLAARLYRDSRAGTPLPADDAAWSARVQQDLHTAWDPRLRYQRRPDGGFAIGIDPAGPLLFADSPDRLLDHWLVEVGPPSGTDHKATDP